jgi:ABC-2 type transport system permease protein
MKSMIALVRREFLEHRGAFFYAPGIILALMTIFMLSGVTLGRYEAIQKVGAITGAKGFEFGFLALSGLWMFYLLMALFFYFADAFSADNRNNSMLFWKSMPQSDFKMLASKMTAGMTLFPALIFGAAMLSGVVVFVGTLIFLLTVPGFELPSPVDYLRTATNIALFDLGYLVLALLWYAPFFGWVGLLSTLFRRWSIPLAFLIPGLVGLAENLLFRDTGPDGGYFLRYLRQRIDFSIDRELLTDAVFRPEPFDAVGTLSRFVATVDWSQLVGGLIVAALLVYAASEYRRRNVAT